MLVSYQATNRSSRAVVGTATFNVTPKKVAQYFVKQECFLFRRAVPCSWSDNGYACFV